MKNDVLAHQGTFEGTYELSTPVNGHPSWISSTNAIWSNPEYPDWWMIGKLDNIGQIGKIIATGMFFGQTKSYEWCYFKGSELKTPEEDDIIVECIARKGESWKYTGSNSLITGLFSSATRTGIIQNELILIVFRYKMFES